MCPKPVYSMDFAQELRAPGDDKSLWILSFVGGWSGMGSATVEPLATTLCKNYPLATSWLKIWEKKILAHLIKVTNDEEVP